MSNVDVDTSEVVALALDLLARGGGILEVKEELLSKVGREVRDAARAAAPVLTGELRASIYLRGGDGWRIIGTDVPQGFYQEFGTSVHGPQPWLLHNGDVGGERLAEELSVEAATPL